MNDLIFAAAMRADSRLLALLGTTRAIPETERPDPLAEVEASEGVCAMGDDDAQ